MAQGVSIVINKRIEGQREAYAEAVSVQEKLTEVDEKDKELEEGKSQLIVLLGSALALFNMFSLLRYTMNNLKDLFSGKVSFDLLANLAFDALYMYRRYRAASDALLVLWGMSVDWDAVEYEQFMQETLYRDIPWELGFGVMG